MINRLLCNQNQTLLEALQIINDNAKGAVFVIDDSGVMIGILTDGDIRRVLLNGKTLHDKVGDIARTEFASGKTSDSYETLLSKLNDKIKIIPVLDEQGKPANLFEYKSNYCIPVAIPNLKGNEFKYLIDAFLSTWVSSSGSYLNRFEREFSTFSGCDHGVAVTNGTVALQLAMLALGIGEGDEVIVPDLTFAATINAVLHVNATPVIVDIEKDSWCISPAEIEKAITPKTKAVIPVHLYGQPCDMNAIIQLSKQYHFYIIEDCAEAHGATFDNKPVGSFGDIGCFSFFGNKVITTGEGGMCVTNSAGLNEKMRILRDHGMSKTKKYWHDTVGYNFRMTNIQAALGCAQLEKIKTILHNREQIENDYKNKLSGIDSIIFQADDFTDRKKITWLVSLLVANMDIRNSLINSMKKKGIDSRPFFYSLSRMEIYKKYLFSNTASLEISERGICLPTYEGIKPETIDLIADELNDLACQR